MISIGRDGIKVDQEPNSCPVCNRVVSPNRTDAFKEIYADNPHLSRFLEGLYECPSKKCGHLFLARFERKSEYEGYTNGYFTYTHSTPNQFKKIEFDERIVAISPSFTEIYNQSANAEANFLSEVCGMGYRKAFEFLIKDYCISSHPDESDMVKGMTLMQCINQYIADTNIKECAIRAAWLGNDETHYQRKWQDKDVGDLKLLINLVIHWIVSNLMTQEYIQSMART
ncbi:DUF4145 domain-containing protein [Vibrio cholerae]|uniref:DUF4145 domain-containing protein n=1 Tax=Vibrio cholerae TaxID=666 RepID=UPI0018F0F853|nr:DUF4145 domain-containing protein [Vibrio cholerae]MBJ7018499.1 DUF4145 domain-containing protein [Vibrio cholerae]MDV2362221.1 DUF4145 domain-containing protein [Vibrio cholerae]